MRIIGHISVWLAGSLLLLHTLLPHEHHDALSQGEHLYAQHQATTLLDLLQLAFHLDQGEGHLESFQAEQEFELISLPSVCFEIQLEEPVLLPIATISPCFEVFESPPDLFLRQPKFRGPPQVV